MKKMYITQDMVMKYGITPGCPGCRNIGKSGVVIRHNDVCRDRMKAGMAKTDDGAEKLQREAQREQRHMDDAVMRQVDMNPDSHGNT